ncbi:restriction endonuclease [Candidatus Woesearchaeota archaeon]|nr:restriction endonuclease [Candidatus Woesearchaeota archaeon]
MIRITRADGVVEEFKPAHVLAVCKRLGVPDAIAQAAVRHVLRQLHDHDSTRRIAELVQAALPLRYSLLYGLRNAVAAFDSLTFELYCARVLTAHGYTCTHDVIVRGESVEHQVDVIAARGDGLFLVECKHHVNPHRDCGLGEVLQVQARLEDIAAGYRRKMNPYGFTQAWLITNTKFSQHAQQYAAAKNILLSGWRYKGSLSLTKLIEQRQVFPITLLRLPRPVLVYCMRHDILTIPDVRASQDILHMRFGGKIVKAALTQIDVLL